MKKLLALIVLAALLLPVASAAADRALVFNKGDEGSKFYRIPAVVTMPDGDLVAVADKRWENNGDLPGRIDVVCRRSTDNGATWSDYILVAGNDSVGGYGDPALVYDRRSGDLVCISTHGQGLWTATPGNCARIVVSRSSDGGMTWGEPCDITDMIFPADKWTTAFATSGRALQLADGRLMFVLVVRTSAEPGWSRLSVYACYSDDGGVTWARAENTPDPDGDESKVVELTDGRVMMSVRNRNKGYRKFAWSSDRGVTWTEARENPTILDPACNGDIISIKAGGRDMLLHSIPSHPTDRCNVSIYLSTDNGDSWKQVYTVCATGSAYSSLTQLADGSIGCLTEEDASDGGFRLWFTRIPLEEIVGGL